MTYIQKVNRLLKPRKTNNDYLVVDLFAGCGGLSLGFEAFGYKTIGYEMNADACNSYNQNLKGECYNQVLDVRTEFPNCDILIGGPPCQPFSVLGNQLGKKDYRNGFPICISTVKKIKPELFIFENVKGLMHKNREYLNFIIKELKACKYNIFIEVLNARHYEVPQNRERIFIVGCKKETFDFPKRNNKLITAGEALEHWPKLSPPESIFISKKASRYIKRYEKASKCITERDLYLDKPARTLTCRNLAGATGDMHRIKLENGIRRQLLQVEASRLQSFPDWFQFIGSRRSVLNQIGNAVPPMMSYHVAKSVENYFS